MLGKITISATLLATSALCGAHAQTATIFNRSAISKETGQRVSDAQDLSAGMATKQDLVRFRVNVATDFLADQTGTADSSPAFGSAVAKSELQNAGAVIKVPSGRYLLSEGMPLLTLGGIQSVTVKGDGSDVSELIFPCGVDGPNTSLGPAGGSQYRERDASHPGPVIRYEGISIVRSCASEGNTGLTINGTAAASDGMMAMKLHDIEIRSDGTGGSWLNFLSFSHIAQADIDSLHFGAGSAGSTGKAISISAGSGANLPSVNYTLRGIDTQNVFTALSIGPLVQGVTLSDSKIVGATAAVDWQGSVGGGQDWLSITGTHIDSKQSILTTANVATIIMSGDYILNNANTSLTQMSTLKNVQRLTITGNTIFGGNVHPLTAFAIDNPDIPFTYYKNPPIGVISANSFYYFPDGPMIHVGANVHGLSVVGNQAEICNQLTDNTAIDNTFALNSGCTNNTSQSLWRNDTTGQLTLGGSSDPNILLTKGLVVNYDNTLSIGSGGYRLSGIYSYIGSFAGTVTAGTLNVTGSGESDVAGLLHSTGNATVDGSLKTQNFSASGLMILPNFSYSQLSNVAGCTSGRQGWEIFVVDGRDVGEAAGAGKGVIATCNTNNQWKANGAVVSN